MIKKPTLISSSCDIASINIKNNILFIEAKNINEIILENELTINKIKNIYDSKNFRLIELNEENIYQDLLDEQLNFIGLPASYIVFLSRHSSKSKIKSLTVHSTGNYGGVFYGGNNYNELSIPYPIMMSKILNELYVLNE